MSREIDVRAIQPGQELEVDFMRPADAPGVAALFRAVYGQGYPVEAYYHPQRLIEANKAGSIISSVARTPAGDIVGHNALFNSAPCTQVYESGAGLVLPSYRDTARIFTRMVRHGYEHAPSLFPVEIVFGEPVCNHVYTQKMVFGLGWTTMAIEVDLMPAEAYTKEASAKGRVTALLDFSTVRPKPHAVYLPAVYEQQLGFLYQALDDQRQLLAASGQPAPGSASRLSQQVFSQAKVARVTLSEVGEDLAARLQDLLGQLQGQGVQVAQVWLNLGSPLVGWAVQVLREAGFFLGGLLPRWLDQDGLLMQRISGPPNWEGIKLQFERAQQLLEMVRQDWAARQAS